MAASSGAESAAPAIGNAFMAAIWLLGATPPDSAHGFLECDDAMPQQQCDDEQQAAASALAGQVNHSAPQKNIET